MIRRKASQFSAGSRVSRHTTVRSRVGDHIPPVVPDPTKSKWLPVPTKTAGSR